MVAVGKTKPVQLDDAGHCCFDVNYLQEFVTKAPQVTSGLEGNGGSFICLYLYSRKWQAAGWLCRSSPRAPGVPRLFAWKIQTDYYERKIVVPYTLYR